MKKIMIVFFIVFSISFINAQATSQTIQTVNGLSIGSLVTLGAAACFHGAGFGVFIEKYSGFHLTIPFVLSTITGYVLEKIVSPVLSIYANILIYGESPPLVNNSAFWYGMGWVATTLISLPGLIMTSFGLVNGPEDPYYITGMILMVAGVLCSIGLQVGSATIPLIYFNL